MSSERKAFNFFKSYWEIGKELDDKNRVAFYDALLKRQFTGEETKLSGMANFAYISQKHSIDAQVVGYEKKTGEKLTSVGGSVGGSVQVQEEVEEKGKEEVQVEEKEELKNSNDSLVDLKNQPPTEKINFDELQRFFNSNRGNFSELKLFSDARKTRIKNLEKKYGKALIKIVIEKARDSDFLQGQNDKGWTASFDWITKPENFLKIAEDNYLNGKNGKPKQRHELTDAEIFTNALGKEAYKGFKFSK